MSLHGGGLTPGEVDELQQQNEQEWDWLFDFIQSFLRSPTWTTPLNNFIDEHCGEFGIEEENKLIYTKIHQQFCELVESLLSKNLKELGVSDEQFVAAVASGSSSNDAIQRIIFGQILAVDDFTVFKKMMIQRNAELEVESMKTLSTYHSPADEEEAQLQFELALALSQSESQESQSKKTAAPEPTFSEDELAIALRLSMLDVEKHQSQYEKEQAELEHVIAMSLAAEAERLRLRELAEQAERDELAAAAAAAKKPPATVSAPKSVPAPPQTIAAPTTSSAPSNVAPPVVFGKPLPPQSIKAPSSVVAPSSTQPKLPSTSSLPQIGGASSSSSSSSKLGGLPPLTLNKVIPPLQPAPSSFTFDHLPLAEAQRQHSSNVKQAEELFAKNQQLLKEQKDAAAKTLSEEELARRKEFLLKQREILLRKKKAERENDLEKFEQDKSELESNSAASSSSSVKQLSEQEELERKKAALKGALVQHLKSVHSEVEMKRAATIDRAEQQSLANQFREMEALRAKKAAQLQAEQIAMRQQEEERRRERIKLAENIAKQNQLED